MLCGLKERELNMSTVSLAMVTWNRASVLKKAMHHSLNNTGRKWDELIWVDNGSNQFEEMQKIMEPYSPTVTCRFKENRGMHVGYNTAFSLCRSDYILIYPPDCLYPDGWLDLMVEYIETLPTTDIVAMYSVPMDTVPERYRGSKTIETINGLPVIRAMPMETHIFKRRLLSQIGYWREDFGLYGWGDVEWTLRAERYLNEKKINYYVIPNITYDHLGSEGATEFKDGLKEGDTKEYWEWKKHQSALAGNHAVMDKCRKENYPYYSPF